MSIPAPASQMGRKASAAKPTAMTTVCTAAYLAWPIRGAWSCRSRTASKRKYVLKSPPAIGIERPDHLEADPDGFAAPFGMENVLRWGYVSIDAFGASLGGLPYLGSGDLTIP